MEWTPITGRVTRLVHWAYGKRVTLTGPMNGNHHDGMYNFETATGETGSVNLCDFEPDQPAAESGGEG